MAAASGQKGITVLTAGDEAVGIKTYGSGALDAYTNPATTSENNALSTTQSIQPESIQVQYYMRII